MNTIHPTAVIGASVRLGAGNRVGPFAVIGGATRIGDDNWIGAHAVLGAPPEARAVSAGPDWIEVMDGPGLVIGDRNTIREGVNVHGGWHGPTTLGDDTYLMNQSYVAHDSVIADGVTLASHVALAGHTTIGRGANLGLGAVVQQRSVIGAYTMIGMGSAVAHDVPPFAVAFGSPLRVRRANSVGMERAGFSIEVIQWATRWLENGAVLDDPAIDGAPAEARPFLAQFASGTIR